MEPSPQAENDSVALTHKVTSIRDATTTQAASSEHPLATSTSAQGDGPVEQHSDLTLSSRGRARKKNPKFMDYETDQDLQEEKTKGKRRSPVRKNVIKGKVAQKKSGRGRKKRAVKPTEDCDDRETAETQPAEPAEEEPSNAPPKKTPKAKKRTPAKTRTPAKKTLPEQPKARKKQATKKQVVQDVGPAETLQADQAHQSTSVPEEEEEQEECVPVGGRPRRSAAKAALKYLHALAREVLGGPSNDVEAQQRSHSGASSPISEPDTGRNAPKRRGWPKGRKRKRRDTEASDGDEDFLPGGLSGEDAEEEEGSEGELESDLEPAVESKAQHRINRNIINQARVHGTAPNGLPNNMLLPCWESTQSNQKFRENHQSSWVFPNWIPSMNDWSIVPQSVLEEYLPQEMQSAAFKISREGLNKAETPPLQKLNRFEAVDTHPERWDTLMFTGGPVWAMEWCPSPDGSSENQYVALACHRGMDDQHCSSKKYHGPGLIQLWDLGKLEYGSSATSRPSLVYGLAQDKGFIWQLKWCPAGAWELPTYPRKAPYLPRLGLLAAATSTGVVTIYSLPHPQALLAGKEPANSEESSQVPPVFKVKGVITLKLGSFRAPHNEMSGQVLSMDWSAMKDHSIVALGFYDGLVGLWNLSSKSSFMRMREPDRSLTFLPYRCFQAHDNCVRALAFCPASSDLLVTAGDDRVLKTWDLTRLYDCINAQKRHLTTEIFWPLHGSGCFLSQESTYAPNGSQGMHFLDLGFNKIKAAFLVPRMATMWSMSFSDWMNCLLTSDTVGEVIFDLLPRLNSNIQNTKLTQQRRFPVYFTDMVPFEASSASDETAAGGGGEGEEGDEEGPAAVPSENDVDRPPGGAESLTQTYREAVKQYYLHYRDFDMRTFKSFQTRQPWKRMRNTEYSTRVDFDVMPLGALHKVRFNPNMSGHTWLVSGGQAGLVRLHCLRSMCREDTKKLVAKCKKQFAALYSPTPPQQQQGQSPLQDTTETVTAALDQHH